MTHAQAFVSRAARTAGAALVCTLLLAGPLLAAEGGEPTDQLFGDIGHAIAAVIVFLGLLVVLRKYAWGPLVTQLEHREKSIAETLEQAQKRQQEAQDLLAQYRSRLDAAQAEAGELLAQARRDAADARERVLAIAQEEAHKAAETARQDIERAKRDALTELHQATANLAADIARRVIRKQLSADDQKRLMQDSLEEIRRQAV